MDDQNNTSLPPLQDDEGGAAGAHTSPPPIKPANATPQEAADADLIEKQWILKAKEIIEHTSNDPHTQQQELAKMKSEYIKKRYNKDIKL